MIYLQWLKRTFLKLGKSGYHYKSYLLLVVAIIFIGVGIAQKENEVVLQKAIHICLECIGIG